MIFLRLMVTFFKIGLFSYGGGLSMLPLLQEEVVANNRWLTTQQFIDMIAISESTPGPIGINMATYVGFHTAGIAGSILATVSVCAPSLIIVVILAHYFIKFNENPIVRSAFDVLRPAVTGLIAAAGYEVARVTLVDFQRFIDTGKLAELFEYKVIILFAAILFATHKWEKHPALYIAIAAVVGIVFRF